MHLTGQARPNVLFETGMAFGKKPNKTIIIEIGITRPISDLSGHLIIKLDDTISNRKKFAEKLSSIGCDVNFNGKKWKDQKKISFRLDQEVV